MGTFKGTKEQWTLSIMRKMGDISQEPYFLNIETDTGFKKVCKIWEKNAHRNDQNIDYETSLANAKLIAAAPEMLEALQSAMRIVDLWHSDLSTTDPDFEDEFHEERRATGLMRNAFQEVIEKAIGDE